jgi:micrococcal nuclease
VQTVLRFPQKAPQPGAFLFDQRDTPDAAFASRRFWPGNRPIFPLFFCLALLLPVTAGARTEGAHVAEVFDGDTVRLTDTRHVRLIGINAPELGRDGRPDEPFAAAARDRLRDLVRGRDVRLVFEEEPRDHYSRWLAHIVLPEGTNVEEVLVREGLASAVAIPPNIGELGRLQKAEIEARAAHRGLWGHPYSRPVPVESLDPTHTGFHFVRGRVSHVGASAKYVYLDMGEHFALRIAHDDWAHYFHGRPESWRGTAIEARGWVGAQGARLHMTIGHPAMLRRLP